MSASAPERSKTDDFKRIFTNEILGSKQSKHWLLNNRDTENILTHTMPIFCSSHHKKKITNSCYFMSTRVSKFYCCYHYAFEFLSLISLQSTNNNKLGLLLHKYQLTYPVTVMTQLKNWTQLKKIWRNLVYNM